MGAAYLYHWGITYDCPRCGSFISDGDLLKSEYPTPPDRILCGNHEDGTVAVRRVSVPRHIGPVHSDTESWASALGMHPAEITGSRSVEKALDEKKLRPADDTDFKRTREQTMEIRSRIDNAHAAGARNGDPTDGQKIERKLKIEELGGNASPAAQRNADLTLEGIQTGQIRDPRTGQTVSTEGLDTRSVVRPANAQEAAAHQKTEAAQSAWFKQTYQGPITAGTGVLS